MKILTRFNFTLQIMLTIFMILCDTTSGQMIRRRDIARGADTAEIYMTCMWYESYFGDLIGGIFRSPDNGEHITVQYQYLYPNGWNELYGDSLPGTLYQIPFDSGYNIGVSHDYGITFTSVPFPPSINSYINYIGGCSSGELYICESFNSNEFYRITNFGDSADLLPTDIDSLKLAEPGTLPGEIYALQWPYYYWTPIGLAFSSNYGQSYTVTYLDTCILDTLYHYTLSCGTVPGELYLAAREGEEFIVHVFHSWDYGHTLELKSISNPISEYAEVSFTAGRTPGSFYMFVNYLDAGYPIHSDLEIYFSRDYGETFTMYFHEIDSTFTGMVPGSVSSCHLKIFPNPCTTSLYIAFPCSEGSHKVSLSNLNGRVIRRVSVPESSTFVDIPTADLLPGIYIVEVISSDGKSKYVKIVKN